MKLLKWMRKAGRVRQQRVQLRDLSDEMLRDIGLDREQARREANRWPWDIGPE